MVDAGENVSATLKREFGEEALSTLDVPQEERIHLEQTIGDLFQHGTEVCNLSS